MAATFPGANVAVIGPNGMMTYPWLTFFQQFGAQPAGISSAVVGPSPFSYTASGPGSLVVAGGTVSSVTFTRGSTTVTANTPVQMANNDVVTVVYSVAPTMSFIPS